MIESLWQTISTHKALIGGVSLGCSILLVVASVVGLPWFIARLPEDYFSRVLSQRPRQLSAGQWLAKICRNIIGALLALVGLAMMVLPGQGLLTLLVALTLLDFPGKRRAELWVTQRPPVRRGLDWLRRKAGKPEFVWDPPD